MERIYRITFRDGHSEDFRGQASRDPETLTIWGEGGTWTFVIANLQSWTTVNENEEEP